MCIYIIEKHKYYIGALLRKLVTHGRVGIPDSYPSEIIMNRNLLFRLNYVEQGRQFANNTSTDKHLITLRTLFHILA